MDAVRGADVNAKKKEIVIQGKNWPSIHQLLNEKTDNALGYNKMVKKMIWCNYTVVKARVVLERERGK